MSLEIKINDDIKEAMRAKDQAALRSLRAIKSAILLAKTSEGNSGDLTEADEIKILSKLAKQRNDSINIFVQQNRPDLAQTEREELQIIERYLPQKLTSDELIAALKQIIAQTGATSPKEMGKVIAEANKQFAGRADGKTIAETVKQLLQ
ncbi:MAG: GatB/YqeY domain-containing protein [Sphingobacteriales bacterium]|jgi:uncharacterized protein YqeY|nr:GatB/YqeY domain-containing protein [Sphingobacteriales bacterium]MBP9140434.1 GatB/YqeY domain-containing protein [Chitinophagales bacterium]MDA0197301.1 GatB/YqeY domain-containing protein [Bacteroidota bacterium]MBK6890122.1 GatB/YqeY domain-containing protein [Sphingobacteriales bacterium]MBK7527351.1 GatB/YqeY domain-containing protein [Sphingobacteriales bacterium]